MIARRVAFRFLWPMLLISALLLGLCVFTAITLYREQITFAEVFRENIESRRAAADLEESLVDLRDLVKERPGGLESLHKRIAEHMVDVEKYSDTPRERELFEQLREAYTLYLKRWQTLPPASDPDHKQAVEQAITLLEKEVIPPCSGLRLYNADILDRVAKDQERTLRGLAYGLMFVGAAGALAGMLLGYGATRALAQSVRRLQIHIRDAAGKLGGQKFPEIVLTQEGTLDRLQEETESLVGQVERVVETLQQREREVLRAEQLAAVGQLAAGVAHEIRNPLTSIKMLVQLAKQDGPRLPPEDFDVIEREVRRMERSLNTFLEFARPPKPNHEWVELRTLVEHTLNLVRGRAVKQRVEVVFDQPPRPVEYHGDPEQLQQVMVNLVLNALDAMPSGGTLEIRLARHADGSLELDVADTGSGIDEKLMPRLFQPFVSNKETGVGLGLVTSRRIVEDHGGSILAANRPGGGAMFTIKLPGHEKRG